MITATSGAAFLRFGMRQITSPSPPRFASAKLGKGRVRPQAKLRYFCTVKRARAIVLIGFMGSGKSCAGAELCQRTGLPVFDTDALIISKLKTSIVDIFDSLGEENFREEETAALRGIPAGASIIVTGGGCILRKENVELMRGLGTIVWLRAKKETISNASRIVRIGRCCAGRTRKNGSPNSCNSVTRCMRRPQISA